MCLVDLPSSLSYICSAALACSDPVAPVNSVCTGPSCDGARYIGTMLTYTANIGHCFVNNEEIVTTTCEQHGCEVNWTEIQPPTGIFSVNLYNIKNYV